MPQLLTDLSICMVSYDMTSCCEDTTVEQACYLSEVMSLYLRQLILPHGITQVSKQFIVSVPILDPSKAACFEDILRFTFFL